MYRRMMIKVLDLFHNALTHIQHAQNVPDCPALTMQELKDRIIYANDSFVAMCVTELWESVDSTLKCVNLVRDYCDYMDAHVLKPKDLSTWGKLYQQAESCIDEIYYQLNECSIREYSLF